MLSFSKKKIMRFVIIRENGMKAMNRVLDLPEESGIGLL